MGNRRKKNARGDGVPAKINSPVSAPQKIRPGLSRDWLWGLVLVLAVILTYSPVWHAGFIWDDDDHVTANPSMIGWQGLTAIWTTRAARFFPLTLTTFWVEHALWGLNPLAYHLVNVFLHAACAILLWLVLRSLRVPGAWLSTALWALHPVEVESVAWIAEMKNTQSALFFLLSILFFVKWLRTKNLTAQNSTRWSYALTLLFAALAMASKSSTVILPIVLCLCAWWVEGRWNWRRLASMAPIFLMSVVVSGLSMWAIRVEVTGSHPAARSWPEKMAIAGDAIWFYLGKLIWPRPLMTIYPHWRIDAGQWFSYLPLLAVIVVLFILWLKRESWARPWFFALAYFIAALLPVLGLVDQNFLRYSFVADHFQYLAAMGPLALAGARIIKFTDFVIPKNRWLQPALCAAPLMILSGLSWHRVWVYQSQETLWIDEIAHNPGAWVARNNLGNLQLLSDRLPEAMAQYEAALRIFPAYFDARDKYGLALEKAGRIPEAKDQYEWALKINPDSAPVHFQLGNIFRKNGQFSDAIDQFEQAVKINPAYAEAHNNLGDALLQAGRLQEAIPHFTLATQINPDLLPARTNLGKALFQADRDSEALEQYEQAVRLAPDDAEIRNNLAVVLINLGRAPEAIAQWKTALQLDPHNVDATNNLARLQKLQEAHPPKK